MKQICIEHKQKVHVIDTAPDYPSARAKADKLKKKLKKLVYIRTEEKI